MLHDDDDSVYLLGLEKQQPAMWAVKDEESEMCEQQIYVFHQADVVHVVKFRTVNHQKIIIL